MSVLGSCPWLTSHLSSASAIPAARSQTAVASRSSFAARTSSAAATGGAVAGAAVDAAGAAAATRTRPRPRSHDSVGHGRSLPHLAPSWLPPVDDPAVPTRPRIDRPQADRRRPRGYRRVDDRWVPTMSSGLRSARESLPAGAGCQPDRTNPAGGVEVTTPTVLVNWPLLHVR